MVITIITWPGPEWTRWRTCWSCRAPGSAPSAHPTGRGGILSAPASYKIIKRATSISNPIQVWSQRVEHQTTPPAPNEILPYSNSRQLRSKGNVLRTDIEILIVGFFVNHLSMINNSSNNKTSRFYNDTVEYPKWIDAMLFIINQINPTRKIGKCSEFQSTFNLSS